MVKKTREILKFSQIIFFLFFLTISVAEAAPQDQELVTADSLFSAEKYTESFEIYQGLFTTKKRYSPAMLLKMAFIKEGLGDYSGALYYLNIYFEKTLDKRTLTKISELASAHDLVGYEDVETSYLTTIINQFLWVPIAFFTLAISIFLIFSAKKANQGKSLIPLIVCLCLLIPLSISANLDLYQEKAIVMKENTHLMDEPSGSANVVETISKGHKLIVEKYDQIWSSVIWNDKKYYVRQSKLKELI